MGFVWLVSVSLRVPVYLFERSHSLHNTQQRGQETLVVGFEDRS